MKKILLSLLLVASADATFAQTGGAGAGGGANSGGPTGAGTSSAGPAGGGLSDADLTALILHKDSLFWQDYNTCNVADMRQFFTDDIEFYHDRGGATIGLDTFMAAVQHGLCRDPAHDLLRREAVKGTVHVYPLHKNGVAYGAIISGQHVFYVNETGKDEYLDGLARFTHLWLLRDGEWKMARVLTYDHGPAPYVNKRKAVAVPANVLQRYAGKYKGPQNTVDIKPGKGGLTLVMGTQQFTLYPETQERFFMKERDLTFTFGDGKLVVREHGAITEELARRQ